MVFQLSKFVLAESTAHVEARCVGPAATYPSCRSPTARVHSRYRRRLADLAIAGRRVMIRPMVRRFFYADASCERRIFAE
ncbi:transposase family protein [Dactylosporangium darangshiense]|uniref:transposase family protein n=1 Tax=Dactylosporangium darangshiense TaxID=579108 RepID=UPI003643E4C1